MFTNRSLLFSLTLVSLLAVGVPSAPAEDAAHARVSYDGGGGMVKGPQDSDWSYATNNTLVLANDTVWVDKGGTMEIEMAGGTFLRMADQSKAEISSLPPAAVFRLTTGSYYIQRISRSTGAVTLRTPACSVEIQNDSMVRVDVLDSGSTTVSVHWGKATVHTDVGSPVVLNADRQCFVDPGYLPSKPTPFTADKEDDFDSWNRDRAKVLAVGNTDIAPMRSVINDAPIGAYDLAPYGQWVTVENEPYWQPTVVDYVPYRSGHWSYMPCYGYVWVGDYPFSYVTTHYGRWTYRDHYGWLWCYQNQWSPAWVASVRYGSDFLWCPLDRFNRPVCYDDSFLTIGGIRFSISASSYCPADALFFGYAPVYGCTPDWGHHVSPSDIFLWDLYARGRNPGRFPFAIPNLPLRDYSPRRVIRGPDTIGPNHVLANQRITSLEALQNVSSRDGGAITGHRGQRTPAEQESRGARVRTASVDHSMLSSTAQLNARFGHTPDAALRTADRFTAGANAPGTATPGDSPRNTPETTARRIDGKPRLAPGPGTPSAQTDSTSTAARIAAGGKPVETTTRRDASRIVRLTNPSTARPPDGNRAATVWQDKPLREDGNAVATPLRITPRTRIAEDQDSPLRAPTSVPRYDGAVTDRSRLTTRSQAADVPDSSRVDQSTTADRAAGRRNEFVSRSDDSTPTPQRFNRSSGQSDTPTPQFVERQAPRIETQAPQRFESAPRSIERQAAPRFEAPSRAIEAPAPRMESPRVAPQESTRTAPTYTPPSRSSSTDNALRGGNNDGDNGPSRSGRGR